MRETIEVEFTYDVTNRDGSTRRRTRTINLSSDAKSAFSAYDGARAAQFAFFKDVTHAITFVDTLGVRLVKAVRKGSGTFVPVTNLNENVTAKYRVNASGRYDNGGAFSENRDYDARSGADAKAQFWNALKSGGAGFCSSASGVSSLTLTVQRAGDDEVLLDHTATVAPTAAPKADGKVREFGSIKVTYNDDETEARIEATVNERTGWDLFYSLSPKTASFTGNGQDWYRAADHITDTL